MAIRRRVDADVDELAELAARVRAIDGYPVYLPDDDHRRFVTRPPSLAAWVWEENGRVAGHVALNDSSSRAVTEVLRRVGVDGALGVVARLLVDPLARRRGIAWALLDTARAAALDADRVPVLDVICAYPTSPGGAESPPGDPGQGREAST